jgi:PAS domain S-box-containing protein
MRPAAAPATPPAGDRPGAARSPDGDDEWVPPPLQRLWDLVTRPWQEVPHAQDRRRAQMLAGLTLLLVIGSLALIFVIPALVAGRAVVARADALLGAAIIVLGLGIYAIARTRHYEAASWLAVFGMLAWVSVGVFRAEGTLWAASAPLYLALAVILSTVLLPLVATVFVAAVAFGLLLVFYIYLPGFDALALSNTMMFLAIASTILVVTHLVRFFDTEQIERQSEEIRESEERYRSLFEASFEGLALHDDGKIIESNQALADMFRMDRAAIAGMPLESLVSQRSRAILAPGADPNRETREATGIRQDGSRFPVEFISKPYIYRGRIVKVTGFRDISERKEYEAARQKARELELANQRLVEVDQMRTRILNVASHELNTPITPLRMQVHLLKNQGYGALNEKQLKAVTILDRNLERLSLLVKDILDVSKIEAGRLRVQRVPVDLAAVVEQSVATFLGLAKERDLELECRHDGSAWVMADAGRLEQVVSNLLSNAVKFTRKAGKIQVTVETRGDQVRVEVHDTGLGLTPEQIARLFQPFEQVHDTMEVTETGSGLGLFICKGILEAHEGRIGLVSEGHGKGSTAWFELPLSTAAESDPKQ